MTEKQKQIADLIDRVIANLGYPVGMGLSPNPNTTSRLAAEIMALMKDGRGD